MGTVKPWYASKTIWGIFIAVIGAVANHFFQIPIEAVVVDKETSELITEVQVISTATTLQDVVSKSLVVIGIALSIYGRVKADTKIA